MTQRRGVFRDDPEHGIQRNPNHPFGALGPLFADIEERFLGPAPAAPGSDTSQAAAESLDVAHLRKTVLDFYRHARPAAYTADEAAARLGLSVLTVRPRCTELYHAGLLEDTGERRLNDSGRAARVLRAVTP